MLGTLSFTYTGPRNFIATDLETKPVCLSLSRPVGRPVPAEVRVTIEGFRAFTDGGWHLEKVDVIGGDGRVIMGRGLPLHFRELVRPGISPGGGQLVGGDHRRIQLCTVLVTRALEPGAKLDFSFMVRGPRHACIFPTLELNARLQGQSSFTMIGEPVILHNQPGPPERLELRTKPAHDSTGLFQGVLFATDTFGNPVPSYTGEFTFSEEVALQEKKQGRYIIKGQANIGGKPIRIEEKDGANSLDTVSPPVHQRGNSTDTHYFGAIHFHTDLSVDGDSRLADAYAYARDWLNLDVVAVTDHAPLGYQWDETLQINEAFYNPQQFVTLPAWESSTAYGHANIYLRSPETNAAPDHWDPARNPSEVTWPSYAIVVPHHPSAGEEPFSREGYQQALSHGLYWTNYDWSIPNPRVRLVEIVQGRGDFEAEELDDYWGITYGNRGASAQEAFKMGWRLGSVGGTDNHQAYPTQMNGQYIGMTCFIAPELTRASIWEAMDQRRTYATTEVHIVADFTVNGLSMGSEGTHSNEADLYFSTALHGTAPIERVEIISNGRTVWRAEPNDWDVALNEIPLSPPDNESAYYYLRLKQADGHRAWLSPIWLDTPKNAGETSGS